jgi:hypothetical protein
MGQIVPHLPQLTLSESSLTQRSPQAEKPALHLSSQVPAEQSASPFVGVGQEVAHAPQFFGSARTSTHEPPQFR